MLPSYHVTSYAPILPLKKVKEIDSVQMGKQEQVSQNGYTSFLRFFDTMKF